MELMLKMETFQIGQCELLIQIQDWSTHNKLLSFVLHRKKETLQNNLFLNEIRVKIKDKNEDQRPNNSNGANAENGNFRNRLV